MNQKTIKNLEKSRSGGSRAGLEARWAVLRQVGRFWKRLGPSWRRLGPVLEASGPSWAEKGGQHGSNLVPKTEPKSRKNRSKNRSKLWCLLGSDFFRILLEQDSSLRAAQEWTHLKLLPLLLEDNFEPCAGYQKYTYIILLFFDVMPSMA